MKTFKFIVFCFIFTQSLAQKAEIWLTKTDKTVLFEKQNHVLNFENRESDLPTIYVDETKRFQTMDGFGFTLTGGSATLINQLTDKVNLLNELFNTDQNHIGISYLRISVGASDLSDHVFSYADEVDLSLKNFSLAKEQKDLIPVLREILKINPKIKILASSWSPPVWMKTNQNSIGGSLKKEFYATYSQYLAKYINAMKQNGIAIDALTIQNEPLNPENNPSLLMLANEQAEFIKNHLGPLFRKLGITTKIILYDHNADRPDYPISILNDPLARKYVDGSAFHLYGGRIETLQDVHEAHPDKNLYFTEQWIGYPSNFEGDFMWHIKNLIIGASRNWCKTILEWNLAADAQQNPHTEGGCKNCLGAITIDNQTVTKNTAYYIIAHASKFVRPNSVRIDSNTSMNLQNVAFKTLNGKIILIVMNESNKPSEFCIGYKGKRIIEKLEAKAVATYVW